MERLGGPLVAGILFLAAVVPVRGQATCSLTQITNTAGGNVVNLNPAVNAAGNRIAFDSNADLLGSNGDGGFEIFLWDTSTGFTQITNFNGAFSSNPAINAAGTRVAFHSSGAEIFLWDTSTGLTQITNTGGGSLFATINATGTRIAFHSDADLLGSNGDGNTEIFLWDFSAGFTQITNTIGSESFFPAINASGTRIAFQSETNPLGSNSDGNFEIFLWDASTGLTQITNTSSGVNSLPAINAAGDRIAFESSADLVGSNNDGNNEIFFWDASTGFTQITNTVNVNSFAPAINAAGNRIAFESNANLLGNGSDSVEIFLWDAISGLTQVTNSNANSASPSIDAAGTRIAFSSSANFLGSNSDGNNEIFLASCQLPQSEVAIPTVSSLGLGILATLLGLAAAWTLRR
jgi:Tol biopolymer transport system component